MPRIVADCTGLILELPNGTVKLQLIFLRDDLRRIMSVFVGLIFSLFCVNHCSATDSVFPIRDLSWGKLSGESVSRNWASSAYMTSLPCGTCCGRSFANRRNNTGPRIDPCTTPCVTGSVTPVPPLTVWQRPESHARNHRSSTPYHPSFSRRRPCSTLSNALEVSAVTSDVTRPLSMLFTAYVTVSSRAASVERPGRKPYCSGHKIL